VVAEQLAQVGGVPCLVAAGAVQQGGGDQPAHAGQSGVALHHLVTESPHPPGHALHGAPDLRVHAPPGTPA
jgi:hypothetical protein